MWYLFLIPLVLPFPHINIRNISIIVILWIMSQTFWLKSGFNVEFLGLADFKNLWLGSALLLFAHVLLIAVFANVSFTPNVASVE